MTLTQYAQTIAILQPVASCLSFESMSRGMSSGSITPRDIHAAVFRARDDGANDRRLHSLARLALAVTLSDADGYFDGEAFEIVLRAKRVARGVLS